MKALISGFALLTFLAASALPLESYAQTSTGSAATMAPDTGTAGTAGTAATTTTKKSKKSSSKTHAKKKSKKPSTTQTSSAKQQHHSMNASKHARHTAS
jgi:hypothetical protein